MSGFDFFNTGALPAPHVTAAHAVSWAHQHFGLDVTAEDLGSQQDANFLLKNAVGSAVAVMRVSNSAFAPELVDEQDRAAQWIAAHVEGIRTGGRSPLHPEAVRVSVGESTHTVRLLRFVDGGTLTGSRYLSPAAIAAMGRISGRVSDALEGFGTASETNISQWDLRQSVRVVSLLSPHIDDEQLRARVEHHTEHAALLLEEVKDHLPLQTVHGDLTDDNLIRSHGPDVIDGVIDFGDVMTSWRVAELAVTLSSVLHHDGASPHSVLPAIEAFHAERPLGPAEITALWPLVVLRGAVLVASGHQQIRVDGSNEYASLGLIREELIFTRAIEVPMRVMSHLIARHLGVPLDAPSGLAADPSLLFDPQLAVGTIDLSVESRNLDGAAWEDDSAALETTTRAVAEKFRQEFDIVLGPAGHVDATRMRALSPEPGSTIRTGTDVWVRHPSVLTLPSGFAWRSGGDRLIAESPSATLTLAPPPQPGERRGTLTLLPGQRYRITYASSGLAAELATTHATGVPEYVQPHMMSGWAPHLFLRDDDGAGMDGASSALLLDRRDAVVAHVQEHYYDAPPRIERGWKHHLISPLGRVYLDMVNNVTVLGHSHPDVVTAIGTQWRTFNSNSRFHYESIVLFSEKIAALLPDPLDTVFLVNSGSEAVELALRLARAHTGRPDLVAVKEAYHGWTYLADAVSTSSADNPQALATRPEWVHTVPAPNSFRGPHRGTASHRYAAEAATFIRELAHRRQAPAAFICEPFYGNAGGLTLPDGYLSEVYSAVRDVGGLTIADEVQCGLGRLGEWFWGFEQQGVVPDIVTMAKSIGDGHPLGVVVTSKSIAESYAREGYFFSSTGGSPVSCVIGSTVLDVLSEEDLPGNARRIGAVLKAGLMRLADRHELIGAVHGEGLYIGVEFVRDRSTLEPATEETAAICDRLENLGVIVQPTGDHLSVLKIKPPLCFDEDAAAFFVAALDRVLTTGW